MDTAHGLDDERIEIDGGTADSIDTGVEDAMFDLGGDERRMHVRAYNHWVSLLKGRPYPSINDLNPANIADFGPHSVLLDFAQRIEDPAIAYLGRGLREECGLAASIDRIADVPSRSLLSRLTDHYLQIIANQAPIGFEAEFVGTRGHTTLYRGILMPFSSDGTAIDYIYGVINWKEVADAAVQATLDLELAAAVRSAPRTANEAAVWADGPSAAFDHDVRAEATPVAGSLIEHLTAARESAAAVRAADTRSRAALYRALGRAHDFALAADVDAPGYAAILTDAAIAVQARAPLTPIVKLVFGADYDKTRLTEYGTVLQHARRHGVAAGTLGAFLAQFEGGVKAVVAAERLARKPAGSAPQHLPAASRPVLAHVRFESGATPGSQVVLVANVCADGGLDIVAALTGQPALAERVLRATA